jgi:hypothetical protein
VEDNDTGHLEVGIAAYAQPGTPHRRPTHFWPHTLHTSGHTPYRQLGTHPTHSWAHTPHSMTPPHTHAQPGTPHSGPTHS